MRFTVHRPASAEVSPRCHRPSGGDVACSIDVGIARTRITGDTLENRLALAIFQRDVPAPRASLRRMCCWHKFKAFLDFMFQSGNQQTPPLAADLTVESPLLRDVDSRAFISPARRTGHGAHIQVFDADGVEAARQISGGLLHPVAPPVRFARYQSRDGQLRPCSSVRSAPCPGKAPLQSSQSLRLMNTEARNVQELSTGQRNRYCHATVNADHAAITGAWDSLRDDSKSDVPAPRSIERDPVGLDRVGDGPSRPEPHPADFGYPNLAKAAAEPFDVARLHADLPESFVPSGLAPGWATMAFVETVSHCLSEVPQCLLLHSLRPSRQPVVFCTGRSQLGTLLVIAGCLAAWLPVLLLLDGKIPHIPRVATMLGQCHGLLRGRQQPKSGHNDNLGANTDNMSKSGKRRPSASDKTGVSTSQIA